MDPLTYYREQFGADLQRISQASGHNRTISLACLTQGPDPAEWHAPFARCASAFHEVHSRPLFLFSYFFSALIDQAIHASLREEHPYFDRLAGYPKLVGVLSAASTNLHPALLLLAATLYVPDSTGETSTAWFRALADFCIDDYQAFINSEYPRLTGRLSDPNERRAALIRLFRELSAALALLFVPTSLGGYSRRRLDVELYMSWVRYANGLVNALLNKIEEPR